MRQAGAYVRAREVRGDGIPLPTNLRAWPGPIQHVPALQTFAAELPCYWVSTPATVARPTGKGEESREGPRVAPFHSHRPPSENRPSLRP